MVEVLFHVASVFQTNWRLLYDSIRTIRKNSWKAREKVTWETTGFGFGSIGRHLRSDVKILDGLFSDTFCHFGQVLDKICGHLAKTLLKQTYAYKTRLRLGKPAKEIFFLYRYNDEKITKSLSNSYVFQVVSHLELHKRGLELKVA